MALRWHKKFAFTAVFAVTIGAGAVYGPPVILGPIAESLLHRNGFPDARIDAITLMPSGFSIPHISLDADGFSTIDGVSLEGNWIDMMTGRPATSLTVKDITLAAELNKDGHYSIAGWDTKLPAASNSAGILPIRSILIQGATIDAETPHGNIRLEGKISLSTPDNDTQVIQYTSWGQQKQLSYEISGKGTRKADGTWQAATTVEDGRIHLDGTEISRMSGYIEVRKDSPSAPALAKGHIVAGRINYDKILLQNIDVVFDSSKNTALKLAASPSGHDNVRLTAEWTNKPQANLSFSLSGRKLDEIYELIPEKWQKNIPAPFLKWTQNISSFRVDASAPPQNWFSNKKNIFLDLTLDDGKQSVRLHPEVTFTNDASISEISFPITPLSATALASIFPLEKESGVKLDEGVIEVSGTFPIHVPEKHPFKIRTKGLGLHYGGYDYDAVEGEAEITSLSPLQFGKPVRLTCRIPNIADKAEVTFASSHDDAWEIQKFRVAIASGEIDISPFTWSLRKESTATAQLRNIRIEDLITYADIDGLTGHGNISGNVPLTFTPDKNIVMGDALLRNDGDGLFAYTPSAYPVSLQGDDARMQTVRESLKDFRYTKLSLGMSGPLSGKMVTTLKAEGTNPVFGTRPIHLNLNLEGDLAALARNLAGGLALPAGDIADKIRLNNKPDKDKEAP